MESQMVFTAVLSILLAYWVARVRLLLSDHGTDDVLYVLKNDLRMAEHALRTFIGQELTI